MYYRMTNRQGFTLLELTVCVIMIAILASMAISYYEHAMENIRRADVLSLLGVEITAQDRYRLTKGHYTRYWHELDTAPVQVRRPKADNAYANGSENTIFYSRGKKANGEPRQGFEVYFDQVGDQWFMVGNRVGSDTYKYVLVRPFNSDMIYCIPKNDHERSIAACLDVMGLDNEADLPGDPRDTTSLSGSSVEGGEED